MDNNNIIAVLQEELNQAYNADLDSNQALALEYYDAKPGNVPKGWSDLVSPDVRDALESTMAEIMGAINPNEPLAVFDPVTQADVMTADLETKAVHTVIFGHNRGFVVLEEVIRDALLQRYGVIKVARGDRIRLEAVPPENFRWSNDLQSPFVSDARFVAEKVYFTKAQLQHIRSQNVSQTSSSIDFSETQTVRYSPDNLQQDMAARDEDTVIQCWHCFLRNNVKGGYDSYLINDNTMLKHEWRPFLPYATGTGIIRPHRFDGVSLFDKLQQVQQSKTFMLRQLATNARLASQTRFAVRDRSVNPEDLMSDELNPIIRCTLSPAESLQPLPVQDVTSQLLATLGWLDGIRRDDGGASIDMASPQMAVANQSAHAVEREFSFRELQSSAILRTLGETLIRSLYLVVHATMKEVMTSMMIRSDNDYVYTNPQQFPERTDLIVDIGATMGTKQRRMAALTSIIAQQQIVLQGGGAGMLITLPELYKAQVDYAKLAGIPHAERYWKDPESPEAIQTANMQAQQAAMEKAKQDEMAMIALKTPIEVERMKGEHTIAKQHMVGIQDMDMTEKELKQKYFDTIVKSQADGRALDIKEIEVLASIAEADPATAGTLREDEVGEEDV